MWTVYILQCRDGTLYTGITDNLPRRLAAHNGGQGGQIHQGPGACGPGPSGILPGPLRRPAPGAGHQSPVPLPKAGAVPPAGRLISQRLLPCKG